MIFKFHWNWLREAEKKPTRIENEIEEKKKMLGEQTNTPQQ